MHTFCCDVAHNRTLENHIETPIMCSVDMLVPTVPWGFQHCPRYFVDLVPGGKNGRWVNCVFVGNLIRVFTSDFRMLLPNILPV